MILWEVAYYYRHHLAIKFNINPTKQLEEIESKCRDYKYPNSVNWIRNYMISTS